MVLYITNDGDIYRQRIIPIIQNMKRKQAKGVYDPKLAVQAFTYAAADGLMKYNKEFGGPGGIQLAHGQKKPLMLAVAQELLRHYEEEIGVSQPPQ